MRYQPLFIGTRWPREALYQRINQRVLMMVEAGLVEEAESLLWRGYGSDLPSLRSIGYRQAFEYLDEKIDHDEMISDIQQKSRHYAKKQMTWYRNNPDVHWLDGNDIGENDILFVQRFLDSD
jgi:tRNA dimethylallyltransferase